MEIYVKFLLFPYFSFSDFKSWFYQICWLYTYRSVKTQQVMTSQIRSHMEYLIQTYYILVPILVEIDEKSSHNGGVLWYDLMTIRDSGLLFWGHPVFLAAACCRVNIWKRNGSFAQSVTATAETTRPKAAHYISSAVTLASIQRQLVVDHMRHTALLSQNIIWLIAFSHASVLVSYSL